MDEAIKLDFDQKFKALTKKTLVSSAAKKPVLLKKRSNPLEVDHELEVFGLLDDVDSHIEAEEFGEVSAEVEKARLVHKAAVRIGDAGVLPRVAGRASVPARASDEAVESSPDRTNEAPTSPQDEVGFTAQAQFETVLVLPTI